MTKSHRGKADRKSARKKVDKSVVGRGRDQSVSLAKTSSDSSSSEKPRKPGTFVPGDPRINRTKPGPGRPRGKFARKCRRVLSNPKTWRAVRRTLHDEEKPAFATMWKEVANRGFGRQGSSGLTIDLPNGGGEGDEPGQNTGVSAVVILMNRLDQMQTRREKAKDHLKESA